jgi:hypothetical protein
VLQVCQAELLVLTCLQGFPGTVHAWVIYKLWADTNRLQTTWLATTDKPTPSECAHSLARSLAAAMARQWIVRPAHTACHSATCTWHVRHATVHISNVCSAKLSTLHEASCAPSMHCCPLDQGGTRPVLLALQVSCPCRQAVRHVKHHRHVPVAQRVFSTVEMSTRAPRAGQTCDSCVRLLM